MLREVPNTDLGITLLGMISQWQQLEFVINAPFRNHFTKQCDHAVKVMNRYISTSKLKNPQQLQWYGKIVLWCRIKFLC